MLTKLTSISKYFEKDAKNGTLTFIGDSLEVHIPKRYEVYGLLEISNTVKTLGIINLIIDETYEAGLLMLASIEMEYTNNAREIVKDGLTYVVVGLRKGDIFLMKTDVIQNGFIAYAMFVEFIAHGKLPYFIDYDTAATLFDTTRSMTDTTLVEHVIFELICAHISRDPDNVDIFYRHTDMKKPAKRIRLRSVSHGPESTTAKLGGSYFGDGLVTALTDEVVQQHHIEDLLRI